MPARANTGKFIETYCMNMRRRRRRFEEIKCGKRPPVCGTRMRASARERKAKNITEKTERIICTWQHFKANNTRENKTEWIHLPQNGSASCRWPEKWKIIIARNRIAAYITQWLPFVVCVCVCGARARVERSRVSAPRDWTWFHSRNKKSREKKSHVHRPPLATIHCGRALARYSVIHKT